MGPCCTFSVAEEDLLGTATLPKTAINHTERQGVMRQLINV